MAKVTLQSLTSTFSSVAKLNANFAALVAELQDKVLYRDNPTGEPNTMESELDMNSNDINNARTVRTTSLYINGVQVVPETAVAPTLTEIPIGSAAAPGLPFDNDANTGFFQGSADTVGISVAGAEVAEFSATGLEITGDLTVDDITADVISAGAVTASGMTITTGGLVISAGGLNVTGTVTLPSHTLANGTTATTQTALDNSTKVATTAYVEAAIAASGGGTYEKVSVYKLGSDSIPTGGSGTTMKLDTEYYDTGNDFNTSTYKFTAPETGYYFVSAYAQLNVASWTADKVFRIFVARDGAELIRSDRWISWATLSVAASATLSGIAYCTAGQTLELKAYHDRGSSSAVSAAELYIARLP